jgi:prepilin-type N-terminal cleavage/methylation domain-containing protein
MKKKGFTLVELLAVIAILAILVIIALPNVMSLFNEAKKNSFANELKEIYKTAQNQWMTDSMINTNELYYSRVTGASKLQCVADTDNRELQLSGRQQLQYGITVDKSGDVIDFVATDGTYVYQFQGTSGTNVLRIENIGSETAAAVDTGNAIVRLSDYNKTGATLACSGKDFTVTTE